jgi:2-oxoglutarate ferredoxin oxidoreductase subunit alpha
VSVELPPIICDIQRAGPSTGMPTKTEQTDPLMARRPQRRVPVAVIASSTPRTASVPRSRSPGSRYRTPVVILRTAIR